MGEKKELQVLRAACLLAALTAALSAYLINECYRDSAWIWRGILGSALCSSLLATLVCVDIWRLRPADSHTLGTLISQYTALTKLRIMAPFIRRSFNRMTREPLEKTTTEALLQIIRSAQDTEYGRKYRFSEIHNIEDFTRLHPLTTHEHYRSMFDRILRGERDILYHGDTPLLMRTSGTTGAAKLFPITPGYMKKARYALEDLIRMNSLTPLMDMKRFFRFHIFSCSDTTSGVVPIGAGSQYVFSFPKHNLILEEYQKLTEEDQSYYTMALFALAEKELSHIDAYSPDLMNAFMKFTIKHWENICEDIERGEIGGVVEMPEEIRESLSAHLQADPERADYLRHVLRQGLVGLAKRAWPHLAFITMAKSAGFRMLATKLIENHFKGVKVIGFLHGGSEGLAGLNLGVDHREGDTEEVFTFYPTFCFMEFIPVENIDEEDPKVVQLHQLEVERCYEIVMTNECGLYRCRYGDIVKVVGYTNNIPKYEFMYRSGQRLNIAYERTPDTFLMKALLRAKSDLNIDSEISDFITTESTVTEEITGESSKGHYVFFIEFGDNLEPVSDLALKIDQNLKELYELYQLYRDKGSIGEVEVIQVKTGSMEVVKGIVMGATVNPQFKMPRVLRKLPAIRHLIENRMKI